MLTLSVLFLVSLSNSSLKKKRTRSIFSSFFCCLRSYDAEPPATPNNNSSPLPPPVEENGAPPKVRLPKHPLFKGRDHRRSDTCDPETLLLRLTIMCVLLMLNRSHRLSLFFCADCITCVWIIVHLSCGSAPHFLSCLFPLSSSLISQCDQVEVIPIPSVCMIPLHSVPSVCVLSHAAWSVAPLYTRIVFWSGSVDSDALCLMDACIHCILYYFYGDWKA